MNRLDLTKRVRRFTRDFTGTVFNENDIYNFLDEAIDRVKQYINELAGMEYLSDNWEEPILLPKQYHVLLAIYGASRCFTQDERHYQSTTFMNEFETKLDELKNRIDSGEVVIVDADGNEVTASTKDDYVVNNYFFTRRDYEDDDGVEGVE